MGEKHLTIIVPFYNEAQRMPLFVQNLLSYSRRNFKDYEILFVDDGSTDHSLDVLAPLIKRDKHCRMLSYKPNRGKGHAVKCGINEARGKHVVFIDSDGSFHPNEISRMLSVLKDSDVVIGDKYDNKNVRSLLRGLTGNVFNFYVNLLFRLGINDTLCGIKGFKREHAKALFNNLKSQRWLFDVEILYYVRRKGLKLIQLPVKCTHKEGTKFKLTDPIKMAIQLLMLRLRL